MNYKQFKTKYLNKTKGYPTDKDYRGQCLSIVKLYIKECFGINPPPSGSNSAYGYWSNFPHPLGTIFEKVKNTSGAIIDEGSIPIWDTKVGNGFGHIEICIKKGTVNTFNSFGQNWNGRHAHITRHNYKNIVGWLKPKVYNKPEELPDMTQDEQRALTIIRKYKKNANHGNLEGAANAAVGATKEKEDLESTITKLQKETGDLKKLQKSFDVRLKKLEGQIGEKDKTILFEQKNVKTANKIISKNIEDLAFFKPYKERYEKKCKESYKNQKFGVLLKEVLNRIFKHG